MNPHTQIKNTHLMKRLMLPRRVGNQQGRTAGKLFRKISKNLKKKQKNFRFWLGGAAPQTPRFLAGGDPASLNHLAPDTKFDTAFLDVTLRRFFACHVASCRFTSLFFAFFSVALRIFTMFCDFGSQKGRLWRQFFDDIGLLQ